MGMTTIDVIKCNCNYKYHDYVNRCDKVVIVTTNYHDYDKNRCDKVVIVCYNYRCVVLIVATNYTYRCDKAVIILTITAMTN